MILLDTHVWVWWLSQPERLQARHVELLERGDDRVFGVSIISCWEIAKLVEYGRLKLDRAVDLWIESALGAPACSSFISIPKSSWNRPGCPRLSTAIRPINCWWRQPGFLTVQF